MLALNICAFILDGSIFLGDAAYPCLLQLITPYRDNGHLPPLPVQNFRGTRIWSAKTTFQAAIFPQTEKHAVYRQIYSRLLCPSQFS